MQRLRRTSTGYHKYSKHNASNDNACVTMIAQHGFDIYRVLCSVRTILMSLLSNQMYGVSK